MGTCISGTWSTIERIGNQDDSDLNQFKKEIDKIKLNHLKSISDLKEDHKNKIEQIEKNYTSKLE